jgi:hypothetical protein
VYVSVTLVFSLTPTLEAASEPLGTIVIDGDEITLNPKAPAALHVNTAEPSLTVAPIVVGQRGSRLPLRPAVVHS